MLRITDALIRNLLWAVLENDMIDAHGGSSSNQQQHLDQTLKAIRSCGI